MARDGVKIYIDGDDSGFKKSLSGIGKVAKKGLSGVVKGITAGTGAAVAALGAITKESVAAFGEYEQLAGGAKLMFGDAYGYIAEKAKTAFKDVQMSQNEYLKQVNGFAVGLRTALGGNEQAAAELADRIVTAEADIVAATGRTAEDVQNAFNGIMKSNFTMIDNLGLGITPTKEGFQEMIDKVNAWKASIGEATNYQITNLADCQSALIDYIEMQGMSGYASAEAAGTIQGSLSMVKASWENLLIGLSDSSQDLDVLIDDVINSATLLVENLEPVISSVLDKLPTMIGVLGKKMAQEIPGVVNTLLPSLVDTASQLIETLVSTITENASTLGESAISILMTLVDTILSNLPLLIQTALALIATLASGIAQALPTLIPAIVETVLTIVDTLLNNIDLLIDVAIELILALADGLIIALPTLIDKVPEIVDKLLNAIIDNAPKLIGAAAELVAKLAVGLIGAIPSLMSASWNLVMSLLNFIKRYVTEYIPQCGLNIVQGIWDGISGSWDWLVTKIKEWCGNILDTIKAVFGINSPSKVMRDEVAGNSVKGLAIGFNRGEKSVYKSAYKLAESGIKGYNDGQDAHSPAKKYVKASKNSVDGLIKGFEDNADKLYKTLDEINDEMLHNEDISNEKLLDSERAYLEESLKSERSKVKTSKQIAEEEAKWRLEKLKKTAEAEREILEEQKETHIDYLKDRAEAMYDAMEEMAEAQEEFLDKLNGETELFREVKTTFVGLGENGTDLEYTRGELGDLKAQSEAAQKYTDMLLAVKNRGAVPDDFFKELRDMSVEEGTLFAEALLNASDEEFEAYMRDWQGLRNANEFRAKEIFGDDYNGLRKAFEEEWGNVPETFFDLGEDAIDKFGEGFINHLSSMMSKIKIEIEKSMSSIASGPSWSGGLLSQASSKTWNPTYIINGSGRETTSQLLKATRDFNITERLRTQ